MENNFETIDNQIDADYQAINTEIEVIIHKQPRVITDELIQ